MALFAMQPYVVEAQHNFFLSGDLNIARTDKPKYPWLVDMHDLQEKNRWGPGEADLTDDAVEFKRMLPFERNIILQNLQYQSLLDSLQGRAPSLAFGPLVSLPELETWVHAWTASEGIHNVSYMHIIRTVINDPSAIFDKVMENEAIMKRAEEITRYYEELHQLSSLYVVGGYGDYTLPDGTVISVTEEKLMRAIYMCLHATNALEAVRFYVSFVCTWAFAENGRMEGIAKIIKLIARDEALHMAVTQRMILAINNGSEGPKWKKIAEECQVEAYEMFIKVAEQEMEWADALFKDGSLLGLTPAILKAYIKYLTNLRMSAVGLGDNPYPEQRENPIPWVNNWTNPDNMQVAPQEAILTDYTKANDANVDTSRLGNMDDLFN